MKKVNYTYLIGITVLGLGSLSIQSCRDNSSAGANQSQAVSYPVMEVQQSNAATYQEYNASLEGKVDVEVRPNVSGYLEKIYVDEGAYVKQGQPLFKINPQTFNEALNNTRANVLVAQANLDKAKVEVDRIASLVNTKVVSDIKLKTAQAEYNAAKATLTQAKAMVGDAQINVGYTLIKAPVSGYIGKIPYKVGSLVGNGEAMPLTMLSDVSTVYVYFSMSEPDFIAFKNKYEGETIEQKLQKMPPVELVLADNSIYSQKGKIELVRGQFDRTTGAINFRAAFPNPNNILRSGNTGKVRLPQQLGQPLLVPQNATFEIQDKVFVFAVGSDNKVSSKPITISGKTTYYYFVSNGLAQKEKIVVSGTQNLKDGAEIWPTAVSADSILKAHPLY